MANYFLNHYSTGPKDTYADAILSLETLLEGLDSTNNPIIAQGVVGTRRDRQQCIGWLIYVGGVFPNSSYHEHFGDNIVLTVP